MEPSSVLGFWSSDGLLGSNATGQKTNLRPGPLDNCCKHDYTIYRFCTYTEPCYEIVSKRQGLNAECWALLAILPRHSLRNCAKNFVRDGMGQLSMFTCVNAEAIT
jgi:hypothetical protein